MTILIAANGDYGALFVSQPAGRLFVSQGRIHRIHVCFSHCLDNSLSLQLLLSESQLHITKYSRTSLIINAVSLGLLEADGGSHATRVRATKTPAFAQKLSAFRNKGRGNSQVTYFLTTVADLNCFLVKAYSTL